MTKTIIPSRTLHNVRGTNTHGNSKAVVCSDNGKKWASALDCAVELGVHITSVSACCLGKIRTCKGLHLHYAYDDLIDPLTERIQEQQTEIEAQKQKMRDMQARDFDITDSMTAAVSKKRKAYERREKLRMELEEANFECEVAEKELNELLEKLF